MPNNKKDRKPILTKAEKEILARLTEEEKMAVVKDFLKFFVEDFPEAARQNKSFIKEQNKQLKQQEKLYESEGLDLSDEINANNLTLSIQLMSSNAFLVQAAQTRNAYQLHLAEQTGEVVSRQDFIASINGESVIVNDISARRNDGEGYSGDEQRDKLGSESNPIQLAPKAAPLEDLGIIESDD